MALLGKHPILSRWTSAGRLLFWVTWPLLKLYLKRGTRTRVVVTCGTKILLVKVWHSDGSWSLPGGGLHHDEQPKVGAVRELEEETGLRLPTSALRSRGLHGYQEHGLSFQYHLFAATVAQETALRPQPLEITAAQWFERSELSDLRCSHDVRTALAA